MTEEKTEAPVPVGGEANHPDKSVEENKTVSSATVEQSVVTNNNAPKASHLRQRWRRKPNIGSVATIREDTTPQPKELKTVQIPTAERLNYPKDAVMRGENCSRRPRENGGWHSDGDRCGGRNRRDERFGGDEEHREKSCGCREGKEKSSCLCHSFLKKAKRFFGKLFGAGNQSEEASCGCRRQNDKRTYTERSHSNDYRRSRRRRPYNRPQNRGE